MIAALDLHRILASRVGRDSAKWSLDSPHDPHIVRLPNDDGASGKGGPGSEGKWQFSSENSQRFDKSIAGASKVIDVIFG